MGFVTKAPGGGTFLRRQPHHVLQFLLLSDSGEPRGMTGSSLSSGFSSSTARKAHTAPLLTVLSCGGVTEGTSKVSVAAPAAKWVPGRNNPDSVLSP